MPGVPQGALDVVPIVLAHRTPSRATAPRCSQVPSPARSGHSSSRQRSVQVPDRGRSWLALRTRNRMLSGWDAAGTASRISHGSRCRACRLVSHSSSGTRGSRSGSIIAPTAPTSLATRSRAWSATTCSCPQPSPTTPMTGPPPTSWTGTAALAPNRTGTPTMAGKSRSRSDRVAQNNARSCATARVSGTTGVGGITDHAAATSGATPYWPTRCSAPPAPIRYTLTMLTPSPASSSASKPAARSPCCVDPATVSSTVRARSCSIPARNACHVPDARGEVGNASSTTSSATDPRPSRCGWAVATTEAATSTTRTLCCWEIALSRANASSRVIPSRPTSTPLACSITARNRLDSRNPSSSNRNSATVTDTGSTPLPVPPTARRLYPRAKAGRATAQAQGCEDVRPPRSHPPPPHKEQGRSNRDSVVALVRTRSSP